MSSGHGILDLFTKRNVYDEVKTPQNVDTKKKEETGMDRLRTMFFLDQYGYQSRELSMITQGTIMSCLSGFVIGGIIQSRGAYVSFIENNHATKFDNHLEAKRQLQRTMYLSFTKGGFRWGWRIGVFSLTFTTLMTTISVYRGKESLLEYIVAGAATGGLFRMNMGLKGVAAGSFLGSFLAGIGGTVSLLVLKIGGVSMNDIRDFSKVLHMARQDAIKESQKQNLLKKETDLADREGDETQFTNMKIDEETK